MQYNLPNQKPTLTSRLSKLKYFILSLSVLMMTFTFNSCEDNAVEEPVKTYTYDGILTDNQNNPVPNATIKVVNNASYTLTEDVISTDITDEDGNFKIKDLKNNLSSYTLKVEHTDYKNLQLPLVELAKNLKDGKMPVKMENDENCCGFIELNILDENNLPIQSTSIKLSRNGKNVRSAKTNENGFAEIKNICDGTLGLRVAKEGYKVYESEITINNCDGEKINVVLSQQSTPPDTCCKGSVVFLMKDSNGNTLKDAKIKLRQNGKVVEDGKTNSDGKLVIDSICEGKYSVLIELEGFKTIEVEVEVKCNETVEVNKTLVEAEDCCKGNIRFFVKDANGNYLANALVKFRINGKVIKDGKTNSNGLIEFEGLCEGTYSVLISLEGYKLSETEVEVKCNQTIDVTRVITLAEDCCKGNVMFWVKNSNNEFIANANIYVKKNGVIVKQGKTDANGKAAFDNLCEGVYLVYINAEGYKNFETEVEVKCNQTIEATRVITKDEPCCKGLVSFVVVDSDGNPIPNTIVKIWSGGKALKELKTDANGMVIDSLCEGTYGVDFKADGYKAAEAQFIAKCNDLVTVSKILTKNSSDCCKGSAKIKFTNNNGEILKNVWVKFRQNGSIKAEAKSDANGYVYFDGLCEGNYSVWIGLDGYQSMEIEVKIECNKLNSFTQKLNGNGQDCCKGAAKILVKNENGEVLKNVLVKFRLNGAVKAEAKTDVYGYVVVDGLCEGKYSVLLSGEGYKLAELDVNIECNKLTEYSKVLTANNENCCNNIIDITVKDKNTNEAIQGAAVYVYLNGQLIKETTTNQNGRVELGNQCKGNYKVKIMKDGYNYEYQEFSLDCGSEKKLVFQLTK